jgi:hypothetical protein
MVLIVRPTQTDTLRTGEGYGHGDGRVEGDGLGCEDGRGYADGGRGGRRK